MAASTTVTLHALGAESASGTGAAIDLSSYRSLRLYLDVQAVTGTLAVFVDSSRTGSGEWVQLGAFTAATSVGVQLKSMPGAQRYARVRWTLGALESATFSVAGDAVQVLATIQDLYEVGVRSGALANLADEVLDRYLERATDFVLGYLPASTTLPLLSWGADLRRATAIVAAYDIMTAGLGVQPDVRETDNIFDHRYHDIREWLLLLQSGSVTTPVEDSTPASDGGAPTVVSDAIRGW